MARRASDIENDDGGDEGEQLIADAGKRKKLLKSAKREIEGYEKELEQIAATKKTISKSRADKFRELKSKLGMKRADVEVAFRLLNLEGDDLAGSVSTIQEIFDTFELREQLDLFGDAHKQAEQTEKDRKALRKASAPKAEDATASAPAN